MDDYDDDDDKNAAEVLVEGQVFEYSELLDSYDNHPQKTCYEHYYPHHRPVVLEDEGDGEGDKDLEGDDNEDHIIIGIK